MRNARGAIDVPIDAVNRRLISHHERGEHARELGITHALKNRIAGALPRRLYRVPPGVSDLSWCIASRRFAWRCTHIARGPDALLPEP